MVKKFVCTFENCKASFSKNSKLVIHERVHTNERPFSCDQCGKAYTNRTHLKRHFSTNHSEVKEIYKCSICMLSLRNLTNLKKHQARMHINGQKYQYQCDECQQGFYKKSQLNAHIFSHTQKAPYTCSQCAEGFLNRASLKKHEKKSHTEYPCPVCNEIFYRWSDLLLHKKTTHPKVMTIKEFKCKKCVKAFSRQDYLAVHEETHKDTRIFFACPEENCEREYLYKRNLLQHIKTAHEKKVFKCEFPNCEQILQHKKSFIHHMNLHNNPTIKEKIKTIKKKRAKRKDAGMPKNTAIMELSGLAESVPKKVQEAIINDSNITINKLIEITNIEDNNDSIIKNNKLIEITNVEEDITNDSIITNNKLIEITKVEEDIKDSNIIINKLIEITNAEEDIIRDSNIKVNKLMEISNVH